jgi:S-formylglutathione hydrolase FrmB
MLPLVVLSWLLVQAPAALPTLLVPQPYKDDTVRSAALGRTMKYRVLLPDGYAQSDERYRALYLLHGLTGDYMDWSTRTDLAAIARAVPIVIVMPDGENAWYTNAADKGPRFEDYIADDLVKDVESKYRVIRARYGRAIAGLSMGGYGALKIGLKHPGTFAAAGGFSSALGVSDPKFDDGLTAYKEQLYKIYGPAGSDTRAANDIQLIAGKAKPETAPALYLDCGTSDGLLDESRELAAILQKRGFAYEYHEVAGAHTWDYWNRRIEVFLPWLMKVFRNAD